MNRLEPSRRPISTYRLQLHRDFGFQDAARAVPYLATLGITEAYSSPHFKANPGSRHGYDICDHGALNPELGSEADYRAYCDALRGHGLGHIIDVVPNHMSADPKSNLWWRDVLAHGEASAFAPYFDIDWDPVKPELRGKVLLPILGDQYGAVLERGELRVEHRDGAWRLRYFDHDLPIDPGHERPESIDQLHEILERQPYRLAYWRTAADEINYRRFFDVNELVGLRMEAPGVFEATHGLISRLLAEGLVTGLRIDHPDGLFDPARYLEQLQELPGAPVYVVAEKILARGESLPADWRVAGTTGYGFLNLVAGVFVDARNLKALGRTYRRLTGRVDSFEETANRGRLAVMLTTMASELNVLAEALNALSERDRKTRDFTLNTIRRVLREVVACYPVYRTYISERGAGDRDREVVDTAIAEARRRNPVMDGSLFDFIRDMLAAEPAPADASAETVAARLHFAMKMQQLTAPVQAKGVEDTAFYRDFTLISANEVGGHPGRPAVSVEEFHAANVMRRAEWPLEMLATATHDTKRGEDARLRIAAISEIPADWRRAAGEWMRINGRHRRRLGRGWAPDRNDEYLFYQALAGVWPAELTNAAIPEAAPQELVERVAAYMLKAVREAKWHTSWIHQNAEYEQAVTDFAIRALSSGTAARFLRSFLPLQRRLAHTGMIHSLSQLVLKMTSPGVPDFYQGAELWDFALVDPDNRRPVDFRERERLLSGLQPLFERIDAGREVTTDVGALLDAWPDGRIKMFVTSCGLRFRRAHPRLFLDGVYEPLEVTGPYAQHVVAFARRWESAALVVMVPRLVMSLPRDAASMPRGAQTWEGTSVRLPDWASGRRYRHLLTGDVLDAAAELTVAVVTSVMPGAMLFSPGAVT